MVRNHLRSGTWVKGHWRNGYWVDGHSRSGTVVSEHDRFTYGGGGHTWLYPVTANTKCWLCDEPVFFYRDEHGGCVLFDSLGWPWPIHPCWEEMRWMQASTENRVMTELREGGYDGSFYKPQGKRLRRPIDDDRMVHVTGYVVDNHFGYGGKPIYLRSVRNSASLSLCKVEISDGPSRFVFLVPSEKAAVLKDYSFLDAEGRWQKKGSKWLLLLTRFRVLEYLERRGRYLHALSGDDSCSYCGAEIDEAGWGLDDTGRIECEPCGCLRGSTMRADFTSQIRRISSNMSFA